MKKYRATVKKCDGYYRIEHPEINIGKGEGVTVHLNRRTGEAWIRKNGRLLTLLIDLKARIKELLIERIGRW